MNPEKSAVTLTKINVNNNSDNIQNNDSRKTGAKNAALTPTSAAAAAATTTTAATNKPLVNNYETLLKQMPEVLCECPQMCPTKISKNSRIEMFKYFMSLNGDEEKQNRFLQSNMKITQNRSGPMRAANGDLLAKAKRVLCKYYLPNIETKNQIEVCLKAFLNAFAITPKRVRMQREHLVEQFSQLNSPKNTITNGVTAAAAAAAAAAATTPKNLPINNHNSCHQSNGNSNNSTTSTKRKSNLLKEDHWKQIQKNEASLEQDLSPVTFNESKKNHFDLIGNEENFNRLRNFFDNQLWDPEFLKL